MANLEKMTTCGTTMHKDTADICSLQGQDSFTVDEGALHSIEEKQLLRKIDRWLVPYLVHYLDFH